MKIVTGGAGFIGSNIVKQLNNRGINDILIVDDLTDGRKCRNLQGLDFFDYMDYADFDGQMADDTFDCGYIDVVFHEGACSDTMNYDGRYMMKNNYEGSKNLLRYCMQRKIPFLYASSASTYGSGKNGFREDPSCEQALNPHAYSKLQFDRFVRRVLPLAKSEIVGFRYFNVFGRRQDPTGAYAAVIPKFIHLLLQGKRPTIHGDGRQSRDFTYVENVIEANLKACLAPQEAYGEAFNIAYGGRETLLDIYHALTRTLDVPLEPIFGPERMGDIKHSNADISKAKNLLDYNPDYDFATGLDEAIQWYKSHL